MGTNVFLSYAVADRALAESVTNALARYGINAVAFHLTSAPGEDLANNLRSALERSDAVVAVLSGEAFNSSFVMVELGAAIALNMEVVVIRADADPLPISFSNPHVHVVDANGMSADAIASMIRARLSV